MAKKNFIFFICLVLSSIVDIGLCNDEEFRKDIQDQIATQNSFIHQLLMENQQLRMDNQKQQKEIMTNKAKIESNTIKNTKDIVWFHAIR